MSNSPLVEYTRISPFKTPNRIMNGKQYKISKITWHHMAGVLTLEQFGNIVTKPGRNMSATYAVDKNGRIGLFCDEKDRPWTSSSAANDLVACTLEISNSKTGDPWPISDIVMEKSIQLTVDICKRNGIKQLTYTGDASGTFTFHHMFASTSCLPVDRTELLTPHGWVSLRNIKEGDLIATAHIDNLFITFSPVRAIVPIKQQDTYVTRDFEGTSDHRVMYFSESGLQKISKFKELFDKTGGLYLPNAGTYVGKGMPLSNTDLAFLVAVQADGHYMKDGDCLYGVEFHLKKPRKIKRLKKLLDRMGLQYKTCHQSNGTTKIRIYGKDIVRSCEEYLHDKQFTWEFLNLTPLQAQYFLNELLFWDGCVANNSYSSKKKINIDVVQAIAALNGVGSKIEENHTRIYFKKQFRSLGDNKRKRCPRQNVSCVSVDSGFILIRQHGRTTITGNCPGPYIKSRAKEIVAEINKRLNATNTTPSTPSHNNGVIVTLKTGTEIYNDPTKKNVVGKITTSTKYTIIEQKTIGNVTYGKLKSGAGWVILNDTTPKQTGFAVGDLVSIASDATYYTGGSIPSWVKTMKWYITSINGDRAVLGKNEKKDRNIQSPVNTKYLTKATGTTNTPIKVGDKVRVVKAIQYDNGKPFKVYVSSYTVIQLKGDRAVISADGKTVTAAVSTSNLQKL